MFTGDGVAKALRLDLGETTRSDARWFRTISEKVYSRFFTRLYLVTVTDPDGQDRAAIISAPTAETACIGIVPTIDASRSGVHRHRQGDVYYRKDCPECRETFDGYAHMLNNARVSCIGRPNLHSRVNSIHFRTTQG